MQPAAASFSSPARSGLFSEPMSMTTPRGRRRRERAQHVARYLHRRGDDDEIVVERAFLPIGHAWERNAGRARIRDLDGKALRAQEMREPRAHLAGAADDQHTLAGAAGPRRHAALLLMRQRCADQEPHDLLRELGLETELARFRLRAFQHFALALIIARRHRILDLVGPDLGDDLLARRHEPNQIAIEFGQTFT